MSALPEQNPLTALVGSLDELEKKADMIEAFQATALELQKVKCALIDTETEKLCREATQEMGKKGKQVIDVTIDANVRIKKTELDAYWLGKRGKSRWYYIIPFFRPDDLPMEAQAEYANASALLTQQAENKDKVAEEELNRQIDLAYEWINTIGERAQLAFKDSTKPFITKASRTLDDTTLDILPVKAQELLAELDGHMDLLLTDIFVSMASDAKLRIQERLASFKASTEATM